MTAPNLRRAFMVFHAVLGGALLIMSHNTLFHALHAHGFGHLAVLGAVEMAAALLLLIPRTLKVGGIALLAILLHGFAIHLTRGEWEWQLLTYAAGVYLVMMHGAAWGSQARAAA